MELHQPRGQQDTQVPPGCTSVLVHQLPPRPPQRTPAPNSAAQPSPTAPTPSPTPRRPSGSPTLRSHPTTLTARVIQEQNVIQAKITPALAGDHRLEEDLQHQAEGSPIAGWSGSHKEGGLGHARGGSAAAHLVLAGPEQADGQLCLVPLAAVGAGGVPDGAAHRAPRHPDVGVEGAGAVAVPAVHEVAELEAVGVILAQRLEKQVSFLARGVLRGVHHQVRACGGREKGGERGIIPPVPHLLSFASRDGAGGRCRTAKMHASRQRRSGPAGYRSMPARGDAQDGIKGRGTESLPDAYLGSSRTLKWDLADGRGGKDWTHCLQDKLVPPGRRGWQRLRCHRRPSACFPLMLTASAASPLPSPAGPQPFHFHSHRRVSFTTQLSPSLNCAQQALAGGKKKHSSA